jgi:hypothetical protein
MPSVIGKKHQDILSNFFQVSRYRLSHQLQNLWGLDYD